MARTSLPYFKHIPFYAYLIRLNNLNVGSIQKITVTSDRQAVERIRELGNSRGAEVKEFVWGGVNITIDIERVELYAASLMQSLGYPGFYSLEDFNLTFDIQELVYKANKRPAMDAYDITYTSEGANVSIPTAPTDSLVRSITYKDCLPTRWTKTVDKGSIQVVESMQVFCRKIKVTSFNYGGYNPEG